MSRRDKFFEYDDSEYYVQKKGEERLPPAPVYLATFIIIVLYLAMIMMYVRATEAETENSLLRVQIQTAALAPEPANIQKPVPKK